MRTVSMLSWCLAVVVATVGGAKADPVPVQLVITQNGAHLERDGQTYYVKGAGGDGSYALLSSAGGNTTRTWGVGSDTMAILDDAYAHGLTVSVGIWLGHTEHGFDYGNQAALNAQLESARQAVLALKDHPAVLVWGIGNEMEGFGNGDDDRIWDHVEAVAAMVKSIDPDHPTMTTIAEIGGARIPKIHQRCPDIDIVGINSYGGIGSIPQRYRSAGGTKPYMITEYGVWGDTETSHTPWGAAYEPTSTVKGDAYANAYQALAADPLCLGSIAFIWGEKREATITWFGMLLEDGSRLGAVDKLQTAWGGPALTNHCPVIQSFGIPGNGQFDSGDTITANLSAYDPDGDELTFEYRLLGETDRTQGGDEAPYPPSYNSAIVSSGATGATLTAPQFEKGYRLYVFVRDGHGAAATASAPLYVFAVDDPEPDPPVGLPAFVYTDTTADFYWNPTGYMGDINAIQMNFIDFTNPAAGATSLRVDFTNPNGWGGVVWQNPDNNWGAEPGASTSPARQACGSRPGGPPAARPSPSGTASWARTPTTRTARRARSSSR